MDSISNSIPILILIYSYSYSYSDFIPFYKTKHHQSDDGTRVKYRYGNIYLFLGYIITHDFVNIRN